MPLPNLSDYPVHLGLDATAESEPAFSGDLEWYEAYGARHAKDGREGRLVSMHTFTKSWDTWEMHPMGHEVVVCTEGKITLIQERDGGATTELVLAAGEYAINPPGCWHTADIADRATALFITAGMGTEIRPR